MVVLASAFEESEASDMRRSTKEELQVQSVLRTIQTLIDKTDGSFSIGYATEIDRKNKRHTQSWTFLFRDRIIEFLYSNISPEDLVVTLQEVDSIIACFAGPSSSASSVRKDNFFVLLRIGDTLCA